MADSYNDQDLYGNYAYEDGETPASLSALIATFRNLRVTSAMIEDLAVQNQHVQSLNAAKLEAGSIIAQDIIFKGTLEGADGTFTGKLISDGPDHDVIIEDGYIRTYDAYGAKNQIGMGGFQVYPGQANHAWFDLGGIETSLDGTTFSIKNNGMSSGDVEFYTNKNLKIKGYNYEPLSDGAYNKYLWSGVNFDEVVWTGLFRADSNWNGIGGHAWKYLNSYGHDAQYTLQEMTDYNATRKGVRVNLYGTWQPWRLVYMGNYSTARAYQYAATRASVTVNHGLGVVPTNIQLTLRWRSGAISLDNIKNVYIEGDPTSTQFTIAVAGVNFAAGQWIDVDWVCAT